MPVLTKINTNSIAEDAITGDKFAGDAYLANTANQNISGTYSENRLYTSDAYTLSGNATVNSHLTLSSIKPTADVVLTAGGAYTLTGTGVLSGGSLLSKTRSDLTGMTGELGSVVTGSPNLNLTSGTLESGVTFPAGHIVGSQWFLDTSGNYANATTTEKAVRDFLQITVTPGNTIILGFSAWMVSTNSGGQNENKRLGYVNIRYHTSAVSEGTDVTSTGTKIFTAKVGRESNDNSTSGRPQFDAVHSTGAFVASASTYYVGASISSIHATITSTLKMSASEPYYFYYYELQGDVLS